MIKDTIAFDRKLFSDQDLIELYRLLLKPRLVEEKMLLLLRQGKISKWFSGIGQEAIAVGVTSALQSDEYIFPLHRNLGVFTTRHIPLYRLFCQWEGKPDGFTKGRDRSFHFGAPDYFIIGMISHLGPQLSLADGVALAYKLKGEGKVVVAFSGEGATSEGEFHEALNVAAVWQLPVLFIIENNGYGLSTPIDQQFKCNNLADKGIGYGIEAKTIDGNNILEVYDIVRTVTKQMRKHPAPYLLVCNTFRRRGHEEASGTKYVPQALMAYWEAKDPVEQYEDFLKNEGLLNESERDSIRQQIRREIEEHLKLAVQKTEVDPNLTKELGDVFAPHLQKKHTPSTTTAVAKKRFVDSISDALKLAMEKYENLVLMGQDIADYGGVFKITEGFLDQFGSDRVRNTPLCESAIIGTGIGLSIAGYKSMIEMQFADFVSCGFNQIVNNMAKLHYRWGQRVDVVVRMPTGAGVGAGPFHSQSNEAWFTHVPGLKVVYPSSVYDAKGLLLAAFEDPNPVLFFEHKALYRAINDVIPDEYYTVEIGQASNVKIGTEVTIITYGMGVHWAEEVSKAFDPGVVEIIDLRTLVPLDFQTIEKSVQKTNKALVLHEDNLFGGIGGEIAAYLAENCFEYLDGPVIRVASIDTPIPFSKDLEKQYLPKDRLLEKLQVLLSY